MAVDEKKAKAKEKVAKEQPSVESLSKDKPAADATKGTKLTKETFLIK